MYDGDLHDEYGRVMILHGANMAGGATSSLRIPDFKEAPDIARMSNEWGMNAMRLITTWAAIEPERGVFDENYLAALEERVTWADAVGIYVIVDMHQILYGEGFVGGDGAPKWTCDSAPYAAFTPTTPWFFGSLDPTSKHASMGSTTTNPSLRSSSSHGNTSLRGSTRTRASSGSIRLNEPGGEPKRSNGYEADTLARFLRTHRRRCARHCAAVDCIIEPGASRKSWDCPRDFRRRLAFRTSSTRRTRTTHKPNKATHSIPTIARPSCRTRKPSEAKRRRSAPRFGSASTERKRIFPERRIT